MRAALSSNEKPSTAQVCILPSISGRDSIIKQDFFVVPGNSPDKDLLFLQVLNRYPYVQRPNQTTATIAWRRANAGVGTSGNFVICDGNPINLLASGNHDFTSGRTAQQPRLYR